MNNFYRLLFLSLFSIFIGSTAALGAPKQVSGQKNNQALQNLKIEFNNRVAKNQDCTDLFVRLSTEVSTKNSTEVVSFLLDLSKKYKKDVLTLSSNKVLSNEVVFEYLNHAYIPTGPDLVKLYENLYKSTPSTKYLEALIEIIAMQSVSSDARVNQANEEKLSSYLDTYSHLPETSSEKFGRIYWLAGSFWFEHGKYELAVPLCIKLFSNESVDVFWREIGRSYLIRSYIQQNKLGAAESLIAQSEKDKEGHPKYIHGGDITNLYFEMAQKKEDSSEYSDAINYYTKTLELESGTGKFEYLSWISLGSIADCYVKTTKEILSDVKSSDKNIELASILEKVLAPEDAAIKISGLHGVISALWEVDKFNEAYPYLKKQALYFSVVIPPSKECVDALFKDELYFRLGYCAFEDQRYWDAIEAYKEIPKNITAQYNLALIWIGNPGIRSKRNAMEVIQKVKLLDKEKYNILMDKYEEAFEAKKTKD